MVTSLMGYHPFKSKPVEKYAVENTIPVGHDADNDQWFDHCRM
jgi:hypothetical protein